MQPLQLFYGGVALHNLGTVSILSQSSAFSPDDLPQKETRTLAVRIDTWEAQTGYNFDTLYANIQTARQALQAQNKVLKWISPGESSAGDTLLERPANVVSHDLPEDANAWGIYHQQINIVFRYELDTSSESTVLTATVTGSSGTPATLSLGQVYGFKDDFRTDFYSEWKNVRRRSSGTITCSGEIFRGLGETGSSTDNRLALTLADLTALRAQIYNGQYLTLKYGPSDNRVFDHDVKVEAFTADINQSANTGSIKWSMTCSYTRFPDEANYCGAEVQSSLASDMESGRETLSLTGRIIAATEALAIAKLAVVASTMISSYGFAATNQTRREVTKSWVNANDTQDEDSTNSGVAVADTAFFELSFNYAYEKKQANVLAYTLTISDSDDLKSGLITRTYSGSVVASSTSEAAAYAAALAQARTLGDKKYPFRLNSTETRNDRKLAGQSALEFVRLEFSYSYQIKGTRIYLELTTSVSNDTFGETQERVSGYVVAADLTTARTQYETTVKSLYTGRLIRNETVDERKEYVGLGTQWYDGSGLTSMGTRLDFNLSAFKTKDTSTYAIKYGVRVAFDYISLAQQTTVNGQFVGDPTYLAAIESGTTSPLDTFLASLSAAFGGLTSKELNFDKEKIGTGDSQTIVVGFSCNYSKAMSTEAQVLRCSLKEDITYSGTRNVFQEVPDGPDVRQICGTTRATRTVSGSVTAATETAAMAWVTTQRGDTGLLSTWREDEEPEDIYEEPIRISSSFEFVPLEDSPLARGDAANVQVCTVEFNFTQICPNLPSPF